MGVKMGWKMGHPLAQNGAALAPFRANGAHPSLYFLFTSYCNKCNRTIGSRSIGHRVWSMSLNKIELNEKHNSAEPSTHSDAVF